MVTLKVLVALLKREKLPKTQESKPKATLPSVQEGVLSLPPSLGGQRWGGSVLTSGCPLEAGVG